MSRIARQKAKRLKKTRLVADIIIIVCLLAIMGLSGFKILNTKHHYEEHQQKYEEIRKSVLDFDALRKINPDVCAWIRYEETVIDYPIVKGEDNEKYLTAMFDGTESDFGTLFVDCITKEPFKQFNTIVYGHHMKNGSMFGELSELKEKSFAKEHPKMKLYTPDGDYELTIWAFLNSPSDSVAYSTNLKEDEREIYIERVRDEAEYTIGDVTEDDTLVVLSTCAYEYENARYLVICKMDGDKEEKAVQRAER